MFSSIISDLRRGWKAITGFISKNSRSRDIIYLSIGGVKIDDVSAICDAFNHNFISQVSNLVRLFPIVNLQHSNDIYNYDSFDFCYTTVECVFKLVITCKKSSGSAYCIPVKILKSNANSIAMILTTVFNNLILNSHFPDFWKTAKVIPVYTIQYNTIQKCFIQTTKGQQNVG